MSCSTPEGGKCPMICTSYEPACQMVDPWHPAWLDHAATLRGGLKLTRRMHPCFVLQLLLTLPNENEDDGGALRAAIAAIVFCETLAIPRLKPDAPVPGLREIPPDELREILSPAAADVLEAGVAAKDPVLCGVYLRLCCWEQLVRECVHKPRGPLFHTMCQLLDEETRAWSTPQLVRAVQLEATRAVPLLVQLEQLAGTRCHDAATCSQLLERATFAVCPLAQEYVCGASMPDLLPAADDGLTCLGLPTSAMGNLVHKCVPVQKTSSRLVINKVLDRVHAFPQLLDVMRMAHVCTMLGGVGERVGHWTALRAARRWVLPVRLCAALFAPLPDAMRSTPRARAAHIADTGLCEHRALQAALFYTVVDQIRMSPCLRRVLNDIHMVELVPLEVLRAMCTTDRERDMLHVLRANFPCDKRRRRPREGASRAAAWPRNFDYSRSKFATVLDCMGLFRAPPVRRAAASLAVSPHGVSLGRWKAGGGGSGGSGGSSSSNTLDSLLHDVAAGDADADAVSWDAYCARMCRTVAAMRLHVLVTVDARAATSLTRVCQRMLCDVKNRTREMRGPDYNVKGSLLGDLALEVGKRLTAETRNDIAALMRLVLRRRLALASVVYERLVAHMTLPPGDRRWLEKRVGEAQALERLPWAEMTDRGMLTHGDRAVMVHLLVLWNRISSKLKEEIRAQVPRLSPRGAQWIAVACHLLQRRAGLTTTPCVPGVRALQYRAASRSLHRDPADLLPLPQYARHVPVCPFCLQLKRVPWSTHHLLGGGRTKASAAASAAPGMPDDPAGPGGGSGGGGGGDISASAAKARGWSSGQRQRLLAIDPLGRTVPAHVLVPASSGGTSFHALYSPGFGFDPRTTPCCVSRRTHALVDSMMTRDIDVSPANVIRGARSRPVCAPRTLMKGNGGSFVRKSNCAAGNSRFLATAAELDAHGVDRGHALAAARRELAASSEVDDLGEDDSRYVHKCTKHAIANMLREPCSSTGTDYMRPNRVEMVDVLGSVLRPCGATMCCECGVLTYVSPINLVDGWRPTCFTCMAHAAWENLYNARIGAEPVDRRHARAPPSHVHAHAHTHVPPSDSAVHKSAAPRIMRTLQPATSVHRSSASLDGLLHAAVNQLLFVHTPLHGGRGGGFERRRRRARLADLAVRPRALDTPLGVDATHRCPLCTHRIGKRPCYLRRVVSDVLDTAPSACGTPVAKDPSPPCLMPTHGGYVELMRVCKRCAAKHGGGDTGAVPSISGGATSNSSNAPFRDRV